MQIGRTPRFKYWVVVPRSSVEIVGWYKSASARVASRLPLWRTAPLRSPACRWTMWARSRRLSTPRGPVTRGVPSDEPTVQKVTTVTRYVERIRRLPDGTTVTERVPVHSERVGTGFGVEVVQPTTGVSRTIGVPRATIAFRYDRPQ